MKKLLFAFMMLLLTCNIHAQRYLLITAPDNSRIDSIPLWKIGQITFEQLSPYQSPRIGNEVDLGLSVKWADCNIGADKPSAVGLLVGWGDITGLVKTDNLAFFPSSSPLNNIINSPFDLPHLTWGEQWRLPTAAEVQELIQGCDWKSETLEGVKGYRITSKQKSKASIFLPMTGQEQGEKSFTPEQGYYWTGQLSSDSKDKAQILLLSEQAPALNHLLRSCRIAIRPVSGSYMNIKSGVITDVTFQSVQIPLMVGGALPEGAQIGVRYATSKDLLNGEQAYEVVLSFDASQKNRAIIVNQHLEPLHTYYYKPIIKLSDGTIVEGEVKSFRVPSKYRVPNESEIIDLGLKVKWAAFNIGATDSTSVGDYFAWGDPTGDRDDGKAEDYAPNVEGDITGGPFDLAHVQWGGHWRMPTQEDFLELKSLTWSYTNNYSNSHLKGYVITGKNGKRIFLPDAGYKISKNDAAHGTDKFYWTSNGVSGNVAKAMKAILATKGYIMFSESDRSLLLPIRAVYDDNTSSSEPIVLPVNPAEPANPNDSKAVDLGLSVLWSNVNMGSTDNPEGSYYAWGENAPKESYTFKNYKYKNGEEYISIGDDIAMTDYDVVHMTWGGKWKMPTAAEFQELIDRCDWLYVSERSGFVVTGPSKKSIFLPAIGLMNGKRSESRDSGKYWTSTRYTKDDSDNGLGTYANLNEKNDDRQLLKIARRIGMLIRPVRMK